MFRIGNGGHVVCISIGLSLSCISLGFLNDLGLDQLSLGLDRVILQVRLGIDLLNLGRCFSLPLLLNLLSFCFDLLDLLLLGQLIQL